MGTLATTSTATGWMNACPGIERLPDNQNRCPSGRPGVSAMRSGEPWMSTLELQLLAEELANVDADIEGGLATERIWLFS
jgi:hypothetical protein